MKSPSRVDIVRKEKESVNKASAQETNSLLEKAEFDGTNGELRIAGTDWILMQGSTFRSLIEGINKVLGTGAVAILFEGGKAAGKSFTQNTLREGTPPEEVPMWLELFFTQGGWGKITARADFANKTVAVTIDNCATARQVNSKDASCHFIRGYIAGICEVLFKTPVKCAEIRCMSKGSAFCEFSVQTQVQKLC